MHDGLGATPRQPIDGPLRSPLGRPPRPSSGIRQSRPKGYGPIESSFSLWFVFVPETPQLTASGRDADVQSAAIGELVRPICGPGFTSLDIGQHRRPPKIPGLGSTIPRVGRIGRAATHGSMQLQCQWTAHQSARRVERMQAVPASEARCAGHPSVWTLARKAPRSEGGGRMFELCRVRQPTLEHTTPTAEPPFPCYSASMNTYPLVSSVPWQRFAAGDVL